MIKQQLGRAWLSFILVFCVDSAIAEDFSSYTDESALLKIVRKIPASDKSANAAGYARLLELNPNRELYWAKFERYSGRNEAALLKIVRGIPASNKSANATGYSRLMALNPNSNLYRAKFKRYSGVANRPATVDSASGLGAFIAGSWCALDTDPTYISGPYVKKVVILPDGNYTVFSKQASAMAWSDTTDKGKFAFREGRYPNTGEKYYSAVPEKFGAPKLLVNAADFTVSWEQGMQALGETTRNSCGKFE